MLNRTLGSILIAFVLACGGRSEIQSSQSTTDTNIVRRQLENTSYTCEGIDPVENPGELVCWLEGLTKETFQAPLTRRTSSAASWLEATISITNPKNPFRATAVRPLADASPGRFENVFIRSPLQSTFYYSGEPDWAEVETPHHRAVLSAENHAGVSLIRDFTVSCALRCDGKGAEPIKDTPVNVNAVPVEERPAIASRCRLWGGGFGGSATSPGHEIVLTDFKPGSGPNHVRLLESAAVAIADGAASNPLAPFNLHFGDVWAFAPSTDERVHFAANRGTVGSQQDVVIFSPVPRFPLLSWHVMSTRTQIGLSSDPNSFSVDCQLEFEAPWEF
ncbi:MAG: hypothetical protein AAB401_12155 [Acidobacteriota bacterium]